MLCDKNTLREKKHRETAALSDEYIEKSNAAILEKLLKLPQLEQAGTVFAYCSVGREVSTSELLELLLLRGQRTALPVCGQNGAMEFYVLESLPQLSAGAFGIPEPPRCIPAVPAANDVMIVPALCCDMHGNRLGHGGGYYDRYLARHEVFTVCLCRAKLIESALPTEHTDIQVNLVITD